MSNETEGDTEWSKSSLISAPFYLETRSLYL